MGTSKNKQLIILIILFLVPALFLLVDTAPSAVVKGQSLAAALSDIEGYNIVGTTPLEADIYRFLDLDDFVFTTYEKDGLPITLYIGYYYTADKVSAAHSPLVCFPGQGWAIDEPDYGRHTVGAHLIQYAQISATLGNQRELIVYWYQSYDTTTPHVYRNKLNTFYNNIVNKDQQHAFVRVSAPLGNSGPEAVKKQIVNFVDAVYPRLLDFIIHEDKGA